MFGTNKEVDADISNLKYEVSLLKEELKKITEQKAQEIKLLRLQLSKSIAVIFCSEICFDISL